MAHGHSIELDPVIAKKLSALATKREVGLDAIASEVINEGLAAMEERLFWEERRKGADVAKGLEILRRAGRDNPPDPGDELPEELQHLIQERRA